MKDTIVVYQSKYGSTRKYAQWLETLIDCDCVSVDDLKKKELPYYDNIIFGGGIHAGGITGINLIKKNYKKIHDKNIIIFAVGIDDRKDETIKELKYINYNKKMEKIPLFFCPGAYDPFKIKGFDKWLITKVRNMIMRKPVVQREDSEVELVKRIDNGGDWTDKKFLEPIIKALDEGKIKKQI